MTKRGNGAGAAGGMICPGIGSPPLWNCGASSGPPQRPAIPSRVAVGSAAAHSRYCSAGTQPALCVCARSVANSGSWTEAAITASMSAWPSAGSDGPVS